MQKSVVNVLDSRQDVVRPGYLQIEQQIRIDLVRRMTAAGVRLAIQRVDVHALHQGRNTLLADPPAFPLEYPAQHTCARIRHLQMQFVDPLHQRQIFRRNWLRLVEGRRARQFEYLALLLHRRFMGSVYYFFALSNPAFVSALFKKSFFSVSCPILAWSTLRSGSVAFAFDGPPNMSAADSCNCCFQSKIWLGEHRVVYPIPPASCRPESRQLPAWP